MTPKEILTPISFLERLPKSDLHIHSTGLIPLEMAYDMQKQRNLSVNFQGEIFRSLEEIQKKINAVTTLNDYLHYYKFFKKPFENLDNVPIIIEEAFNGFKKQNIHYIEIRASINALDDPKKNGIQVNHTPEKEIETFLEALEKSSKKTGIITNLILCIRRGMEKEDLERAKKVLELAKKYSQGKGARVVGIDVAGKEFGNEVKFFQDVFLEAKEFGLGTTAHAGEAVYQGAIRQALFECRVDRIGHGTTLKKDSSAYRYIKENNIGIEYCPEINSQFAIHHNEEKGIYEPIENLKNHKIIKKFRDKIFGTINTDAPNILGKNLTQQIMDVSNTFGLTKEENIRLQENSLNVSFTNECEKQKLQKNLNTFAKQQGVKNIKSV